MPPKDKSSNPSSYLVALVGEKEVERINNVTNEDLATLKFFEQSGMRNKVTKWIDHVMGKVPAGGRSVPPR